MRAGRIARKTKKRAVKSTARTVKKATGRPRGRPKKEATASSKGPTYRCSICGTEVVVTSKGKVRPRIYCCGMPMRRRG